MPTLYEMMRWSFQKEIAMAVPADFSCSLQIQNNQLQSVLSPSAICPHCEKASTFAVRCHSLTFVSNADSEVRLILVCNYAPCQRLCFVLIGIHVGFMSLGQPIPFICTHRVLSHLGIRRYLGASRRIGKRHRRQCRLAL